MRASDDNQRPPAARPMPTWSLSLPHWAQEPALGAPRSRRNLLPSRVSLRRRLARRRSPAPKPGER